MDDLKEGKGAEFVDKSLVTLVFCSRGYFTSTNCMRELLRGVFRAKPFICLMELEAKHGGMLLEEVETALQDTEGYWGLAAETAAWGFQPPKDLYTILVAEEVVEWNRIGAFQDVTLRLIAERILKADSSRRPPDIYVQGELASQQPRLLPPSAGHMNHVYCSPHNLGALALMYEV